jgi:uncharacterized cupredoxin-like copper-binding protein
MATLTYKAKMKRLPLLLPLALLLAACGGGGSGSNAAGTTSSTARPASSSGQTVMVGEKEFSITPSSIALTKPGTYTFKATNNGHIGHALEIEGHGIEQKTATIGPGKTATLQVEFSKAGSYEVYCPIDDHKNKGMKASLTVGGSAAPAVGGTSTEGTTTGQTSTTKGGYGY